MRWLQDVVGIFGRSIWIVAALSFSSIQPAMGQQSPQADTCIADRTQVLALDEESFDQDLSGGWRAVASRPGCRLAAADLVRDYRAANDPESFLLHWHEGQLRAMETQTEQAIHLFERSRRPAAEDEIGWNHYVDATIAFLGQDLEALRGARAKLIAIPIPPDFTLEDREGNPIEGAWPLNLDVVDAFVACFGREYIEAYGSCRRH